MKNIVLSIISKYLEIFPEEEKRQENFIKYLKTHKTEEVVDWNNFEGHIVTGGFIYSIKEKKFLVLYHKDLEMYVYPGGHVDSNDINPLTAACREVNEETGLNDFEQLKIIDDQLVPIDIDTHIVRRNERLNLPEHYHFDFRYLFVVARIQDIKTDSEEMSSYKWISLDELTNNDIKDILVEKTSNTEKLAGLILKFLKFMIIFIIVLPLLLIGLRVLFKNIHEHNSGRLMDVSIKCTLHDETYGYEFNYYETTGEIKEAGGDAYLSNIIDIGKYSDAYRALDVIDNYVKNNGGTCTRTEPQPVKDK